MNRNDKSSRRKLDKSHIYLAQIQDSVRNVNIGLMCLIHDENLSYSSSLTENPHNL